MAQASDIAMWAVVGYKDSKSLGALHPQHGEFLKGEIHPSTLVAANAAVDGCIDYMIDCINNDAEPEWDRLCVCRVYPRGEHTLQDYQQCLQALEPYEVTTPQHLPPDAIERALRNYLRAIVKSFGV
jgi:hypothetical protein